MAWREVRWRHGMAVPSPVPWLTAGTGTMGAPRHRDEPGHRPPAPWCSRQHLRKLLAPGPSAGHAAGVPPPSRTGTRAPACPDTPLHPGVRMRSGTVAIPGAAPRTHGVGCGAWRPPPQGAGAHPCPSPMGAGQWLQPPPKSCREHPGDGKWLRVTMETGPPARHAEGTRRAEGTRVPSPEERSAG